MAILKIVTGEQSEVLRRKAAKVLKFDKNLKKFAQNLKETMIDAKGLGIAAPQVGESRRIFWVTLNYGKEKRKMVCLVNPEILEMSAEMELGEEGCLSLPGRYGKVSRAKSIVVKFFGIDGSGQILKLDGLDARVVQHEYDHIEGILFIDRMEAKVQEDDLLM